MEHDVHAHHDHAFEAWPFEVPVETGVFTTRQVLEDGEPVREAHHDADGDWQFLCGTTRDAADLRYVCMGCMLERDATLAVVARLPVEWTASRGSANEPWVQAPYAGGDAT